MSKNILPGITWSVNTMTITILVLDIYCIARSGNGLHKAGCQKFIIPKISKRNSNALPFDLDFIEDTPFQLL